MLLYLLMLLLLFYLTLPDIHFKNKLMDKTVGKKYDITLKISGFRSQIFSVCAPIPSAPGGYCLPQADKILEAREAELNWVENYVSLTLKTIRTLGSIIQFLSLVKHGSG